MKKTILVPHDFTEVGDFALEHAYMISKSSNSPINLIHIVRKTSQIEEAKRKLQEIADNFIANKTKSDVQINVDVRRGNLFKEIYNYGVEIDAYLAVMGTHGEKTVKKAMKVVKKFVKIPFILVQSPVQHGEYDRIVVPIDHDKSARIKIQWIRYINTLFKSNVYIITHNYSDGFKQKSLAANVKFAQNWFERELIDFDLKVLENGKNFADEIYNHANEVEADLILVMTDKYREYVRDLKRAANKELFKKIPIMCVNKRTDIIKLGGFN